MRKPDLSALGAGIAILALGALLIPEAREELGLRAQSLAWVLGGCALAALVASALGSGRRRRNALADGEAAAATELGREAGRISQVGVAIALAMAAVLGFLWANDSLETAGKVVLLVLGITTAVLLISAPFWLALFRRLGAERVARARSEERAELGAHLHDSVLQTLALIQKRADDPEQVTRLARRQERDLRVWLSDERPTRPGELLADALRAAALDIEDAHGAPIEAIVVGDAPMDERFEALVAATREALTNAAKFASAGGPVRLYAEIENGAARVFVDDRGPGFDPATVPADRRGVRESIIGRMERHGGTAEVRSEPDSGTEVELAIGAGR